MSSSSTVGLGFPRLISSKKATLDAPNTGNGPISDYVGISRSLNELKGFFLSPIKEESIKDGIKRARSSLFEDPT